MAENRQWVEIWLSQHRRQMIQCPHQPGNLVISRKACFDRYRHGQKFAGRAGRQDVREKNFQYGFSLCSRCPIGSQLEKSPEG